MANVIARVNRPTLVLAHNKTLAAQLYQEFKAFFPENAVEYFVSYYDYYQPEAYVPQTDTYIEKEATINDEIDRLRLSRHPQPLRAARRRDRGLGLLHLRPGLARGLLRDAADRRARARRSTAASCCAKLVEMRYERNDIDLQRGTFRVRGDVVEIVPAYEESGDPHRVVRRRGREDQRVRPAHAARRIGRLGAGRDLPVEPLRHARGRAWPTRCGRSRRSCSRSSSRLETRGQAARGAAARAAHDVRPRDAARDRALPRHRELLAPPLGRAARASRRRPCSTTSRGRPARGRRVATRRSRRCAGCTTATARARDAGRVRLPAALGARQPAAELRGVRGAGRPGRLRLGDPGPYELQKAGGVVVEQVIRPPGSMDPEIEVRPVKGQVDDLLGGDPRARGARASACWSRRSPSAWPRT